MHSNRSSKTFNKGKVWHKHGKRTGLVRHHARIMLEKLAQRRPVRAEMFDSAQEAFKSYYKRST